jgi:hypothetical protein
LEASFLQRWGPVEDNRVGRSRIFGIDIHEEALAVAGEVVECVKYGRLTSLSHEPRPEQSLVRADLKRLLGRPVSEEDEKNWTLRVYLTNRRLLWFGICRPPFGGLSLDLLLNYRKRRATMILVADSALPLLRSWSCHRLPPGATSHPR